MKLKFKPSSQLRSENSNIEADISTSSIPESETSGMGKGMIFLSIIIFLGLMTVFFQTQIEQQKNPNQQVNSSQNAQGQTIVRLQRNRAGHYVANGSINGQAVTFLLDTGATDVAIPLQMQHQLNLQRGRQVKLSTANGLSTGYQTRIEQLKLGKITLQNIRAVLTPNLNSILLGMSALKQLDFSQTNDQLIIKQ